MSADNNSSDYIKKENRTTVVLGILTILIIVGIFFALLAALYDAKRIDGQITADAQTIRRGNAVEFRLDSEKLADGTTVKWFVDGSQVAESIADDNEAVFTYTPQSTGKITLQAQTNDGFSDSATFEVLTPKITLTAPTMTITYGDEMPDLCAECDGIVDGDVCDCDDNDCVCRDCSVFDLDGKLVDGSIVKLPAGRYTLRADNNQNYLDYELETVDGTLEILPRKLSVEHVTKTYDGTANIAAGSVRVCGILPEDDVSFVFDDATFDGKDVGANKRIDFAGARLEGNDADNYLVDFNVAGTVLPRKLTLVGVSVADKVYDGTTKAQIKSLGKLIGVVDGDSVAIGSVLANFAKADVGTDISVNFDDITLVGIGKENYVFVPPTGVKATIFAR